MSGCSVGMSRLTPLQGRFVDEYLTDLNGKQAAIRAGYSARSAEVTASRLLSNAKVAAAVAEAQSKIAERNEVTQDWIIAELKDNLRRCKQAVPVLDKDGEPTGEYASFYSYDEVEEVNEERFNRFINLGIAAEDMKGMLDDTVSDYVPVWQCQQKSPRRRTLVVTVQGE